MAYQPKYLTPAEVDAIYQQELKNLEAIHLRAGVTHRRFAAFGPEHWDPETGHELIQAVHEEWQQARGGEPATAAAAPEPPQRDGKGRFRKRK
jgi:hypothetical protein